MFNIVVLTGRLTADPELKTTQSGLSVTSFSIAVDRRFGSGEERQTDFINIVAWRQQAEFVAKYFKKGNLIGIEGSIQTRKYTDKNGNNRTAFEVVANNIHPSVIPHRRAMPPQAIPNRPVPTATQAAMILPSWEICRMTICPFNN